MPKIQPQMERRYGGYVGNGIRSEELQQSLYVSYTPSMAKILPI